MGYTPKRGHAPKFMDLGSSPNLSTDLPDLSGTTDKPGEEVDLTKKTGLGPRTDEAMNEQFPQGNDKFTEDQIDARLNKLSKDHDVSAHVTEGTVESQELLRKQQEDDPGSKYDPSKDKE